MPERTDYDEKLVIHHAYNGLLYAPMFLADSLGLFPGNCELRYVGDDAKAIQAICDGDGPKEKHWFALCDPLSERLIKAVPKGGHAERLCIVGSFISAAPVWLYCTNHRVQPISSEEQLKQYRDVVRRIVTYLPDTTGHLFGERLKRLYFPKAEIIPVSFGDEFSSVDSETLVVTSDALRIEKETLDDKARPDNHAVIFSYPNRGPEALRPFMFTALVTLRDTVLKRNLDVLLGVLGALRNGVHYLNQDIVAREHLECLVARFDKQLEDLGYTTMHSKVEHLRAALKALRQQGLYDEALVPDLTALANSEKEWVSLRAAETKNVQSYVQRVPALLLRSDRFANEEVAKAVLTRMPFYESLKARIPLWPLLAYSALLIVNTALSGVLLYESFHTSKQGMAKWFPVVLAIACLGACWWNSFIQMRKLWRGGSKAEDKKHWTEYFWLAILPTALLIYVLV